MKIVIDIPEAMYEAAKTDMWCGSPTLGYAIKKGTQYEERPQWNPIKYRPMTEEEVRETEERWGIKLTIDERVCFACSMPEDDQEILVCTGWGHIFIDRCEIDPDDGYALEENGDWDGIVAWMPLPKPFVKEGEPCVDIPAEEERS